MGSQLSLPRSSADPSPQCKPGSFISCMTRQQALFFLSFQFIITDLCFSLSHSQKQHSNSHCFPSPAKGLWTSLTLERLYSLPTPHRPLIFIFVGPSGVKTFSYPWPDVSLLRADSPMAARGFPAACWIDSGKVFEWELVNLRMLQLLFEASAGKCFLSAGTNLCCQPCSPSWLSIQCCTHLVPGALCTTALWR